MGVLTTLEPHEVAVFETFVVPRYLSMFGVVALEMVVPCGRPLMAHVGCRTGFPDQIIGKFLPGARVIGFDPSEAALELARTKSALIRDVSFDYRQASDLPLPIGDASFSHAIVVHPLAAPSQRPQLFAELRRLLAPGGQALIAMPLRGSFQELADLLREYALKTEASDLAKSLEANIVTRPTIETFCESLEDAGFDDVDVDMRLMTLSFKSGRDFFEDPIARIMIVPDLKLTLGMTDLTAPIAYIREAIDRYWSETEFELSVNVGCASARR